MKKWILLISTLLCCACNNKANVPSNDLYVYYYNTVDGQLEKEKKTFHTSTPNDHVLEMLSYLKENPKNQNLQKVLPEDLDVLSVSYENNLVLVNFSGNYQNMSPKEELFLRAAFVFSFCEFPFVDGVKFSILDKPLLDDHINPLGIMKKNDFIKNSELISPDPFFMQKIVLYFSDDEGMQLKTENRTIAINQNESIEKHLIDELKKGPTNPHLLPTLPKELKIRNLETKDNTCYVDLPSEFFGKISGGSSAEDLAIYSIVNTLTDSANQTKIEEVQFLIEGEKQALQEGHFDLTKPITAK